LADRFAQAGLGEASDRAEIVYLVAVELLDRRLALLWFSEEKTDDWSEFGVSLWVVSSRSEHGCSSFDSFFMLDIMLILRMMDGLIRLFALIVRSIFSVAVFCLSASRDIVRGFLLSRNMPPNVPKLYSS